MSYNILFFLPFFPMFFFLSPYTDLCLRFFFCYEMQTFIYWWESVPITLLFRWNWLSLLDACFLLFPFHILSSLVFYSFHFHISCISFCSSSFGSIHRGINHIHIYAYAYLSVFGHVWSCFIIIGLSFLPFSFLL